MNKIILVTPIANEERTIESFLSKCNEIYSTLNMDIRHLLIMDDFSKDETDSVIKNFIKDKSNFELIHYKNSSGVVSCYIHGHKKALHYGADYIIEIDSGFSHPPEEIPKIIEALDQGYQCVFMSRLMNGAGFSGVPFWRQFISFGANLLTNQFFSTTFTDAVGGFKAFKKEALIPLLDFNEYVIGSGWQIQMKILANQNLWIELPYIYKRSQSTFKFSWILNTLEGMLILRRYLRKL
ncbi:MAG: glycosyltransferase [Bacteriovoracaceae bacterium]|nr:glycosyltransferase [Bacteriovoracaceae bacterium]